MLAIFNNSKGVSGLKRLIADEGGNVAFMIGIAAMPLMLILGTAVDYERAANTKVELQSAVDSAALYAAALGSGSTNTQLTNESKPYFTANYNAHGETGTVTYAAVGTADSVKVTASVPVTNAFMAIAGYATTTVGVSSTVKKSGINLEVSLVLDNTGSMNSINLQTGNTAVAELKAAAAKFVTTVMPSTQGQFYTKIAAIPYNNGVNLGVQAAAARGPILSGNSATPGYENYTFPGCDDKNCTSTTNYTLPITNCVTERTGTAAYTDAAISMYPAGRGYLGQFNPCAVKQMVSLTTNATTLTTTINSMSAGGSTAGQVGIAWGWYALSPNIGLWSGESVPAGYDKLTTSDPMTKVKKVMVLMTDAEYNSANYNGVITGLPSVTGSGGYADHINQPATNGSVYGQSTNMCNAIKASGVEVFVITFQLKTSFPERVALVNSCATDAKHLIDADNTSLDSAFTTIATQLQEMRIAE